MVVQPEKTRLNMKKLMFTLGQKLAFFLGFMVIASAQAIQVESWQVAGVQVLFVAAPELPMVDVQLVFKSGSAADPKGQSGLARFTEAQLLLGNQTWSEQKLANRMADFGAEMSSGSDPDQSYFRLRLVNDNETMSTIIPVWFNLLAHPKFSPERLHRDRNRSIASYREGLTQPGTVAHRAFFARLFGDHPYGNLGDEKSYSAINVAALNQFYRQHYHRGEAQLTLVGALSRAEAEAWAEKIILALPKAPAAKTSAVKPSTANMSVGRLDIPFASQQTHILLGLPFINRQDPDLFPLLVGNYILGGGGFSSRLMKVVRVDQGLAYSIYSTFTPLRDRGAWWVGVQTRNDQAERSLTLLKQTVREFIHIGPTEDELAAAKQYLVNSFPLRLNANSKILDQVSTIGLYNLPLDYLDTWIDKVQQVSLDQIKQAFSRKIKDDAWTVVLVGEPKPLAVESSPSSSAAIPSH